MIGIYKIENPEGKVYIGQSRKVEKRLRYYNLENSKGQVKLNKSFVEYGIENHNFELIQECEVTQLNITERYWQDFYDSVDNGLNCKRTDKTLSSEKVNSGRKKLNPEDKLTLFRVWVRQDIITQLGEENIKQECAKTIEKMLNNLK